MNLKKLETYLQVNLLGPGPPSYKKRTYRAAVSQRLRNTDLCCSKEDINRLRYIVSTAEGTVTAQFQILFEHITRDENHENRDFNRSSDYHPIFGPN
jgi:hypothetical protein